MKTIDANTLRQKRRQDPSLTVINVLDEEQFQQEHIPGSQNIPVSKPDFARAVEQNLGGKDKPIVVYCSSQECDASPKAAQKLERAGFQEVYDFEGGLLEWKRADLPVEGSR